jgi:hypothetical protein
MASDPPDSAINPLSGLVETVDAEYTDSGWYWRHVVDPGDGISRSPKYVRYSSVDPRPRLTISSLGDSWITWQEEDTLGSAVLVLRHSSAYNRWSDELVVTDPDLACHDPEITHDGLNAWIAYESRGPTSTQTEVSAQAIHEGPDPVSAPVASNRTVLSTTVYEGDIDVLIHYQSEHLWVTWVHTASRIGWSEYDYELEIWRPAEYEIYDYETDDVEAARERIAQIVLSTTATQGDEVERETTVGNGRNQR